MSTDQDATRPPRPPSEPRRRRVVVVGSVNVDLLVRAHRHPAPGETVVGSDVSSGAGGKGLNQAVAAARAGADVVMVGAVGDDDGGRSAVASLRADGVDADRVATRPGVPTGQAVVVVDDAGENAIVVVAGANGAVGADDVDAALHDLGGDDVVLLQHELPTAATRAAARAGRAAGATVVWNAAPAPRSLDELPDAVDLLVVNEHELLVVAGLLPDGRPVADDPLGTAASVGAALGAVVVVTRGGEGSAVVDGDRREQVPAATVDVVDTTAAGDTFIGYLVSALPDAGVTSVELARAGTAAGLAVTRRGAAASIPRRVEVDVATATAAVTAAAAEQGDVPAAQEAAPGRS